MALACCDDFALLISVAGERFFVSFHSCEGIGHPCAPGVAGVAMKHRLQHSQKASNFARHEWLMETHVPLVVDGIWC